MLSFNVYLNNRLIDIVFYDDKFFKGFKTQPEMIEYVKNSLVNHDGYNSNIKIIKK